MTHVTIQDIATRGTYSASTATSFTIPSGLAFFALTDFQLFSGTTELSYNATPTTSTQFATSGSAVDGGYMGGNFILGAASSGNNLTYVRNTAATRTDDFTYPSATINIKTINTALDKLFAVSQQLDTRLDRALVLDSSDTGSVGDLGTYSDRASKFLGFDSNGQVLLTALTISGTTTSVSAYMASMLDDADAATAMTTLGLSANAQSFVTAANYGAMRTALGVAIGSDVQAYDADTLKADTADVLTAGFAGTPYNAGTKSSGTYTPNEANGNLQYAVNGGAHTLAPPTNNCSIVIQYTNNASAGTITTSGFTKVTGSSLTTTNGDDFFLFITKHNGFSHLHVQALQ